MFLRELDGRFGAGASFEASGSGFRYYPSVEIELALRATANINGLLQQNWQLFRATNRRASGIEGRRARI